MDLPYEGQPQRLSLVIYNGMLDGLTRGYATMMYTNTARRGFTLIELMVVIVILGIAAAIAMPNLLRARIQANHSATIAALKAYADAQSTWRKGGFALAAGDGVNNATVVGAVGSAAYERNFGERAYADTFRNLYYGFKSRENTTRTEILSKAMADAFYPDYTTNLGLIGRTTRPTTWPSLAEDSKLEQPFGFNGYRFAEDAFMYNPVGANGFLGWNNSYALIAYPAIIGRTGERIFWIGFNHVIMETYGTAAEQGRIPDRLNAAASPFSDAPTIPWRSDLQ